ncbi:MAG TPA: amino acid adenylation domain-containing protein [Flavitalea sp.]|nr:amino acid adenylation domain-containing protein [Flavitalea sp.]
MAGEGLARGYLNQPVLTASKFIEDSFSKKPGAKMYKTGDLARWLPDGNIEYMGRIDEQMKVRGHRIEPGEIESVLQEYEEFDQAVVALKEDKGGNKRLIGYVVPKNAFSKEHIDSYLKSRLPEYMIPSIWVELQSLPLTSNGKIDRKLLPNPNTSELLVNNYIAPRNEVETAIAAIWSDLLSIEQVGVLDNFFQLGGHSLLAMRVVSAIRKKLEVEVAVRDLFLYPTVQALAKHVSGLNKGLLLSPVEVQVRPKNIPLSFSQERLWFIHQLEGSQQYHVPIVLRLTGNLNHDTLNSALRDLVNRHEILRTVIREEEGRAYQHIMDKDLWSLSVIDGSIYKDDPEGLQLFIKQLEAAPFDLSNDHVIRGHLIVFNENDHVLEVTLHHIASDGWSKSVLVKELLELYNARIEDRKPSLPQLDIQYADFAIWQRTHFDGEVLEKKLSYWKDNLKEVTPLELPTDHARPAVWSTRGASINFELEKELADRLHELSQQKGATLFMTLLAAFKVLLYRYSGQQDICVGSAIAGRQQQELESLIGFFVNTLAFRSEIDPDATFSEFLRQVQKTTMEAYAHQEAPFEKVVEAVINERSLGRNPLVQVMFALLNTPEVPELRLGDIKLSNEGVEHTSARFDITFFLNESPQGLRGSVEYATDLYNEDTIVRMIGHFKELLTNIVASPHKKIELLPILTKAEKNQLLFEFNQTELVLSKDKTLVDLFEIAASERPDALALSFEHEQLTYRELNERSNQLAHYLVGKGVQKETPVPVFLERSIDLFVAFLGIMKAGACYLPIDPKYPEDRIRYMLEDTGADMIITWTSFKPKLPLQESAIVIALDDTEWITGQPTDNLGLKLSPANLVNIIYTSGSTGQPKGVMVEHRGMVNMAGWYNHQFKVSPLSRFTTMTGVGFDAFGFEIWPALTMGAALFIVDNDTRLDTSKLSRFVNANGITHCLVPTALIQEFVSVSRGKTRSLEYLLCGGDKLSSVDIEGLNFKVINNYGPTEFSIVATSYELTAINKNVSPAIGPPIANTRIYIVDDQHDLVPIGVAGEICLNGASLARGYLNSKDLTAEKFVSDPFSKENEDRMYKTGDIGRWLSDGHIEYIRRKDDQVKIRGHRIELGEIESVLQQTGLVSKAVVLAKEVKEGDKRLLSYLVPDWEVVKQKEHELYSNQVAGWQELYDTEYSTAESEESIDTEFNIVGWNDSFTKEAIPAEQMKEWLDDIIELILSKNPGNVLEIGSGSGLIYYQLAGRVKKYIGTDISRSSISQIQQRISKGLRDYGDTELKVCAAHEVSLDENEEVDTIVINSVAQYFPGEDYLSRVIKKSISLLKGKGRIVIGDVRDNRLLRLFKSRLLMQRLQDSVSVREFNWLVDQDVLNEEELCFSPDYFYNLTEVFPEITHVEIQWKRSSYINELTLYRYNVVIHVGINTETSEPLWESWTDIKNHWPVAVLLQKGIETLAFKNIPSNRLVQERLLYQALGQQSTITVGDIALAMRKAENENEALEQLLQVANANGYRFTLLPNQDPLKLNVVIQKGDSERPTKNAYNPDKPDVRAYTNIPLFSNISSLLQRDIRALVQQRLPEYMIPAEFMVIGDLPLTRHGKVDKKFLSQRKDKATVNRLSYEAPRTEVEQVLANIWQELLSIERVGIHDNFFELGGHSLLATRTISAVRKQLYVELFIKDLFVYPTIAQLAAHIGIQSKGLLLPPLESQQRPEHIPLSFSQERLWFIDRLEGSIQYHMPAQLRLKGTLDVDALKYALRNVVNRHEVLRTVMLEDNGVAYQHVMPKDGLKLSVIDGSVYKDDAEWLRKLINRFVYDPFDLSKDHMLRASLIMLHDHEHILLVTMHHIASDGWSVSIIVKEVVELYNSYKEGTPVQLSPLRIQYADFSIWQRTNIVGKVLESKIQYWKEKLDQVAPLQLPTDFSRPLLQSTKGSYVNFKISKEISSALISLSQQQGATLFMTLLSAFKVLLHRYSGQEDICVGTPIAGRQQQEVEDLVGFFVNTLALRTQVNSNIPFTSLLQEVKTTTLEAYAHQELPFEKVVDVVVKERNMARSPLFQVMFIFQNTPEVPTLHLGNVQLIREASVHDTTKFELSFNISQTAQGVQGSVEYCTDLYREDTIKRMIDHYIELLGSIVQTPEQKISRLRMLPQTELDQLLVGFNDTYSEFPKHTTIVDLFEKQVKTFPGNIAVVFGNETVTYQQLNERSNSLAHLLQSKGVTNDSLVPICLERSIDMIVGMLGILKAGGAYVPIDPDYPADRIQYMVEDTEAPLVVTGTDTSSRIKSVKDIKVIELDKEGLLDDQPTTDLQAPIQPHNLAYVIYTSGSTGKPKGVLIEHRNVVRLFKTKPALYDFNERDVWSVFHSFCFDFSVWEMYGALFYGGKMVVVPKQITKDVIQFAELLIAENVTILNQTPSAFYVLQDALIEKTKEISIRYVIFGGEALNPLKVQPWKKLYRNSKLINMYGITETTVHVTYQEIEWQHTLGAKSVIGKPIPTLSAYIVDSNQNPVPIGVPGELLIGGAGLARGYLNRPELTAERFIMDPYTTEPGGRLYRTGDLGAWLPDGTIEYLGRIDEQVKIRGYRIELGEIEAVLQESQLVRQAVVMARTDKESNKRLVGYIVPEGSFNRDVIVSYLQEKLPDYMVPALWVEMQNFPLTSNGKIDKKALPEPDASTLIKTEYVAPRTEMQQNLAQIWCDLLGLKVVGIEDNFFELGGDSILTIQVVSRARRLGYELQPRDIFLHQTISHLSEAVLKQSAIRIVGEQGLLTGGCGLTPIQQWFLQSERQSHSHFNQSILLGIDKSVSSSILNLALEKLIQHHDALRFRYYQKDEEWYQEYGSSLAKLAIEDLRTVSPDKLGTAVTQKADTYQGKLDIEKGQIIQMVWMQTPDSEKQNRLLFVIHHLAIDGVSWRIIVENLEFLLTGLQKDQKVDLGIKTSSYRQWHEALCQYGQRPKVVSQISYWEKILESYQPFSRDKANTQEVRFKDMGTQVIHLGAEMTTKLLQEVPKVYHTEINDILLCALGMTLNRWGDTDKIIVGLEGHGREEISKSIDISQTVGWFTSLYPVLIEMPKRQQPGDAIKSVKEQLRQVPDKGLGYGVLKHINKEKKLTTKAGSHILFNYLGQFDNVIKAGQWLAGVKESAGQRVSDDYVMNDQLQVTSYVQGGQLVLNWIYNSGNYDKEAINELVKEYQANLELLIDHCVVQQNSGAVFTPSDYGLSAEITYQELDKFLQESYNCLPRRESLEGLYRLSGLQQGMLFHGLYNEGAGSYLDQFSCDLAAPDLNAFNKSWEKIIQHHSILRSAFYSDVFSVPVQCVYGNVELPVSIIDYRHMTDAERAEAIKRYAAEDRIKGFDFKSAPLMRVGLFRLKDDQYKMLWTSHHLLFDGWSLPILMEEFLSSYDMLVSGRELDQSKEDRYEDYIRYLERSDKEDEETYWRKYMSGIEQGTFLPFVEFSTQRTKGAGEFQTLYLHLDETVTDKIKTYSQNNRITVNTIMQGVWCYLLHQYTGNDDIAYGVIVSGRPDDLPGVEQRVGMYINTLPLHSRKKHNQKIADWLQQIQDDQVASRQYQFTPLQNIQLLSRVKGDLFDTILVFENYPVSKVVSEKKWSLNVRNVQMKEQTNYPLTITVGSSDQTSIVFHYNTYLLKDQIIQQISNHFENVLLQLIEFEAKQVSDIKLLTKAEEALLLEEFSNNVSEFPHDKSIVDLFEAQAAATPGSIALVYDRWKINYRELNERSNKLAHYLISKGVQKDTLVPLCIEKSVEMMVGILGILKAGGAYVPLDPGYPAERINLILQDTDAQIILTDKASRAKLQFTDSFEVVEVNIPAISDHINQQSSANPNIGVQVNQLAYVMYTSGSMGRPKGVLIEHGNVVSLVKGVDYVSISQEDILLSTGAASFDATTFEYWAMLLNGGQLVLCNEHRLLDAALLKEEISERKVTTMWFTSSWFNQLVETDISVFTGLKTILVGGEKLSEYHIMKMKTSFPSINVINGYGPTENTTFSLTYQIGEMEEGKSIPIGKPLSNRTAYILNEDLHPVPVGVTGEIYLGGAGVARGYLNSADLTNEKFIEDPFGWNEGEKLYKTGDLGRWLADGNIEYQGRIDEQVKIRGFRIEPDEINSVLQQSNLVSQSVIVVKKDQAGNKRLVGYVVPQTGFNTEAITNYLRSRLPDYMVPNVWVELNSMPLTSNGKVDKKVLPDSDASELVSNKYLAPRNEIETSLIDIWKKLLRVEQVGVKDNFFELGGHSLLGMRLLSVIRKEFGVNIPLVEVFDTTVEVLAQKISDLQRFGSGILEMLEQSGEAKPFKEVELGQRVEAGLEWGHNENGRYMIPLSTDGTRLPFFGIISFNSYRLLGKHMTKEQPLYYLPPTQAASVEDIASHYVREIKLSQPTGPYVVGGFCGGGKIALEVAHQLEAQGDHVAALVLFEFYSPRAAISKRTITYKKRRLAYYKDRILALSKEAGSPVDLVKYVLNKSLRKLKKPIAKPAPPKYLTNPAYRKYQWKPYSGKVILFQASITPLEYNGSPIMGWEGFFTGDVEIVGVQGGHLGIFREPAVKKLAEKLAEALGAINTEVK